MKFRLVVALLPILLFGCGSSPEDNAAAEGPQGNVPVAIDEGFFTNLLQFVDIDEIRSIGTEEGRPMIALDRINNRYGQIIEPHRDLLKGARVLDFGSYDGRWTYAALDAGASYVKGIEINQDFTDQAAKNLTELGVSPDRYEFVVSDLLTELKKIEPGTFDGIICAGIYYHITYHVELMREMRRLDVDWIIMDSSVVINDKPIIQWSISPYGLEGTPSPRAIEMIAEDAGFQYKYIPFDNSQGNVSMWDYNVGGRITMTLF